MGDRCDLCKTTVDPSTLTLCPCGMLEACYRCLADLLADCPIMATVHDAVHVVQYEPADRRGRRSLACMTPGLCGYCSPP